MTDVRHEPGQGTDGRYQMGCRCAECRSAHARKLRIWRSKHPQRPPLLGWYPPAALGAWVRAEAARRDVPLSVILTEALAEARARSEAIRPQKDQGHD